MNQDVVVAGAGITGSACALALAKNPALNILLIDQKAITEDRSQDNPRVSAITLSSANFLQQLDVWDEVKNQPLGSFQKMHVWDAVEKGKITFDCLEICRDTLGYIVEDRIIRRALLQKVQEKKNIQVYAPFKLENEYPPCKLLIGADGANSWVRKQAGIEIKEKDYNHTAVTAMIETEKPHQHTAWQCFLPAGTLAFLPLANPCQSSMVWSTQPEHANELLHMSAEKFSNELNVVFENKLGHSQLISSRAAFPLCMRHAKKYIQPGLALIGDAAHTLHPLAGLGVNLGLQDTACLTKIILNAINKQRDYSSLNILRRYERERKSENTIMIETIGLLKTLFMSDNKLMQSLRSAGLNLIDKTYFLKKMLIQ